MNKIPECFYRVSAKALVLNETKDKFLIMKENNDWWDLPGGGLDWGTSPHEDIPREINEEMSLEVTSISQNPSYFCTNQKPSMQDPSIHYWFGYVFYETTLKDLNFTPSDECIEIAFVDKDHLPSEKVHLQVQNLADMFDPSKH